MEDKFVRTMAQLEKYACMWWPKEIRDYADKVSILQSLLDTQEKFISIITLADSNDPSSIFRILQACDFPKNLFLKHLMILTGLTNKNLFKLSKRFPEYYSITTNPANSLPITLQHIPIKAHLDDQFFVDHPELCLELAMLIVYSNEKVRGRYHFNDVLELMSLSKKEIKIIYENELVLHYNDFVSKRTLWSAIVNRVNKIRA